MTTYDIFNGDADGLCALRQLRLQEPLDSVLVTGVKRDVALLGRIQAQAGDRLTVLDIALAENLGPLERALEAGATCRYFDHHYPGPTLPSHPRLSVHIRYSADTCTSLIVDDYLGGRFRAWAVVAAFGDNLPDIATVAARPLGLRAADLATLERLGQLLNYNAYGDTVDDLIVDPAVLYRLLSRHDDPLAFSAQEPAFERLASGYDEDMRRATACGPMLDTAGHFAVMLPDAPWSRRVHGPLANALAAAHPDRAHAVLVRKGDACAVSIRAPVNRPAGADALARRYPTGGGRTGAAGINRLPHPAVSGFLQEFEQSFRG